MNAPKAMLATLTDRRFSSDNWLFERKLDGVRALSERDGGAVKLWSRNEKRIDGSFPELAEALASRGAPRFVADGEIVAFDGSQTSFAALQPRIHLTGQERIEATGVRVFYYVFDLLSFEGEELRSTPLRERKRLLRHAFRFTDPLRLSAHRLGHGEEYYQRACARGWEGLIAKRADSLYQPGRSTDWLKFKCVRDQEFVVGGFTDPKGARSGFGALLVGYYDGDRLRYAGKVGTGYNQKVLRSLRERMGALETDASPFADRVREPAAHWVAPELVAQIGFTEWTTDGRLRHPRFTGLRNDKSPTEVVRETS
ncbi:DNA ligase D-like protein (predicted ligase) [Actinophytocola algeriensis]|uniref:DNA ligase (ATP) n=2 Tax=Actinophytocola algeriensis TaxID=1768010 RepID=A0A7W7QAN9_9PSEU|nr:DNA ligase D-like protein (predicted ligase) [Actinophytocola algeriensis]MBE1475774.1 DNA ligase D-like protein (predicted ligase) [Actinophytocola algeriensis]